MQNEPNLPKAEMNVSYDYREDYENKSDWTLGENEPKRTQFKPNSKPKQTQFKPNLSRRSLWRSRIKPNHHPPISLSPIPYPLTPISFSLFFSFFCKFSQNFTIFHHFSPFFAFFLTFSHFFPYLSCLIVTITPRNPHF